VSRPRSLSILDSWRAAVVNGPNPFAVARRLKVWPRCPASSHNTRYALSTWYFHSVRANTAVITHTNAARPIHRWPEAASTARARRFPERSRLSSSAPTS
jgi:hypothetical protein